MQSDALTKEEISMLGTRLVGARGAMAAQRVRAVHLAAVAELRDEGPGTAKADPDAAPGAKLPEAREPLSQPPAIAKAEPKRRRKLALIGAGAALAIAVGGWFGYNYFTVGRFIVS